MKKGTISVMLAVVLSGILSLEFAPEIAGFLMKWKYPELSGSALRMKSLAELGGGVLPEGGYGLAGGSLFVMCMSVTIVALIGIGVLIVNNKRALNDNHATEKQF